MIRISGTAAAPCAWLSDAVAGPINRLFLSVDFRACQLPAGGGSPCGAETGSDGQAFS